MRSLHILTISLGVVVASVALPKEKPVKQPETINAPLPGYPAELPGEKIEGAVEIRFEIDQAGMAQEVKAVHWTDERLKEPCTEAVRQWTFKTQKSNGEPKGRVWFVTIVFEEGRVEAGRVKDRSEVRIPPVVLKQVAPVYPSELSKSGNLGKVVIRFVVDQDGDVRTPEILTSTHPAFEAPAVAALLQWKFAPGTHGGRPVSTRMQLPVSFEIEHVQTAEAFSIEKNRRGDVPEMLKVDVLPKPKVTVFAVHPYEHAISETKGTAEVRILVGPKGDTMSTRIVKASRPEFGLALAAAMEAWTFEPALRDGQPAIAVINRKHEFETRGRDSAVDYETSALANRIRKGKFEPAKAKELDSPLRAAFTAPAVYPTALLSRGFEGIAKIELIVDKRGRAVLPRIVEASEPEFGWAAATAAQRWRFDPPTVGGKPVEVRVMIPFQFTPSESEPKEEEPTK